MYRCKNYKIYELVDRVTHLRFGERAWMFFDDESLMMIDGIREYFSIKAGKDIPMVINDWYWKGEFQWSGLRPNYCKIGSKWSIHRLAKGFDIKCEQYTAEEMRAEILANKNHELLKYINRMEGNVNWLHVDRANIENRIVVFYP
jgi:hypothetical protein